MSASEIKVVYSATDLPKLRSPHLVCGFPGSGYVGKLAVDHLIEELPAKHLVDIYSSSFPPQVMIKADGTADLMKNSIFWWRGGRADLLLLTGDSQPANPDSEYALAEQVLDIAAQFGTEQVFTLAAYITGVFVDKPKVFGTGTDLGIVNEFAAHNISTMDSGSITGMNGLVIGIAKLRNMKGMCLLGETSGYVVDAKGNKSKLPRGSSDAALRPYRVDRSKLFVMHRVKLLDAARIANAIESTRFPSPAGADTGYSEEGMLVQAANLIGQLGDPHYLRKANALYYEFEEVGINKELGYSSPADLTDHYPKFYWSNVSAQIQGAIRYLNVTSSGRQWVANLYSNVFRAERELHLCGPQS